MKDPKFEWRINNDRWNNLLLCMPDPDTRYTIVWAAKERDSEPVGIIVHRESSKGTGYLGDYNFVVSITMTDDYIAKKGFALNSLFYDLWEAKELAWRDYQDNIIGGTNA